jgi:predicted DNA-binding protein (MmcQ/YjbR family)
MILLDEPSMGLAPQLVEEIFEIVRNLNVKERVSFLLAEQNTMVALRFADYGYILENGRVVMDGAASDLAAERGREGVLSRAVDGGPQELSRREALPPSKTVVGLNFESLRRYCATLARRDPRHQWGADEVYSVGAKMFSVFGIERGKPANVGFKCDPDRFLELTDQDGIIPAPYLARAHWVLVQDAKALSDATARETRPHFARAHFREAHEKSSRRQSPEPRRLRAPALRGDVPKAVCMSDHFDLLETRAIPKSASASCWRNCRGRSRTRRRMPPRVRAHSCGGGARRRSPRVERSRRCPSRGSPHCSSCRRATGHSAGSLRRDGARRRACSRPPGPDLRAGRSPCGLLAARAATVRGGLSPRRPHPQLLLLPLHAGGFDVGDGRARVGPARCSPLASARPNSRCRR